MTVSENEKQRVFEQQALVHSDALYRFGLSLAGNSADAHDLVQDTYLRAYLFWDQYSQGTNIRAWLCRILKNSFINLFRRRSRELTLLEKDDGTLNTSFSLVVPEVSDPQDVVFKHLLGDNIANAILDLDQNYRTVVILRDLEDWSYEEIAGFTGCPLGTVRSRIYRGRKLLHSMLHEYAKSKGYAESIPRSDESLQYGSTG